MKTPLSSGATQSPAICLREAVGANDVKEVRAALSTGAEVEPSLLGTAFRYAGMDIVDPLVDTFSRQESVLQHLPWLWASALSCARDEASLLLLERFPVLADLEAEPVADRRRSPLAAVIDHQRWKVLAALLAAAPATRIRDEDIYPVALAAVNNPDPSRFEALAARASTRQDFVEALAMAATRNGRLSVYVRKASAPAMRWAVEQGATCWITTDDNQGGPVRPPALYDLVGWPAENGSILARWCARSGPDVPAEVLNEAIRRSVAACSPSAFERLWALRQASPCQAPFVGDVPLLSQAVASALSHAGRGLRENPVAWTLIRKVYNTGEGRHACANGETPLHTVLTVFLVIKSPKPATVSLLHKTLKHLVCAGYSWDTPDEQGRTPRDYARSPEFISRAPSVAAHLEAGWMGDELPRPVSPPRAARF